MSYSEQPLKVLSGVPVEKSERGLRHFSPDAFRRVESTSFHNR